MLAKINASNSEVKTILWKKKWIISTLELDN